MTNCGAGRLLWAGAAVVAWRVAACRQRERGGNLPAWLIGKQSRLRSQAAPDRNQSAMGNSSRHREHPPPPPRPSVLLWDAAPCHYTVQFVAGTAAESHSRFAWTEGNSTLNLFLIWGNLINGFFLFFFLTSAKCRKLQVWPTVPLVGYWLQYLAFSRFNLIAR